MKKLTPTDLCGFCGNAVNACKCPPPPPPLPAPRSPEQLRTELIGAVLEMIVKGIFRR